jgi:hypothetical protein
LTSYTQDLSFLPVALAGGISLAVIRFKTGPLLRNSYWAGLLAPAIITLAGNYPRYYSWLAYIPLTMAVVLILRRAIPGMPKFAFGLTAALLIFSILTGLPARTALTLIEWKQRDYFPVDCALKAEMRKSDVLYTQYQGYYASKYVYRAYFPDSIPDAAWTRSVTVMNLGSEDDFIGIQNEFGGKWIKVLEISPPPTRGLTARVPIITSKLYQMDVWRKVSD